MKIKVVGLQNNVTINFTDRATKETSVYHGRRIHYHYTLPDGEGIGCNQQFLNDTKFAAIPIEVDDIFICDMAYGKIARLEKPDAEIS